MLSKQGNVAVRGILLRFTYLGRCSKKVESLGHGGVEKTGYGVMSKNKESNRGNGSHDE